jgi:peroxiredoxin
LVALFLLVGGLLLETARNSTVRSEPPLILGVQRLREFSLPDVRGAMHVMPEWSLQKAVVLFFLGVRCPVSNAYASEMASLYRTYGPRKVLFLGLHSDPGVTTETAARHAAEHGLGFPILLDPEQAVAGPLQVNVTPEAAVLSGDGYVLYRGRIDDRSAIAAGQRKAPVTRDLAAALDAVLADEMPVVTRAEPFGSPLPPPRARSRAVDEPITFNTHVATILWKSCAGCHHPGDVAPFSLLTYQDAAKRADFLKEITAQRRMPPWKPLPGYGHFLDDLRLSNQEIEIIGRWANEGAIEGDLTHVAPPQYGAEGWTLGQPDLVVPMPEPFEVNAEGQDIYQAFVIPLALDRARTVVGVEFRPGNRKVVHHARLFIDSSDELLLRDRSEPGPGFRSFGGGADILRPGLAEWIPGTIPRLWPEGAGKVLSPRSKLVLLAHYHPIGKPTFDQSSVGLHLRDTPPTRLIASVPLTTTKIDIPPGASRHKIELKATMPADAHAFGLIPHGHFLLRELKLTATMPDGAVQPMVWINDWDFNWQGQYRYVKPVKLPKGTKLHLIAYYDNSAGNPSNPNAPPRRVRFGLGSNDEMLGCHIQVIPDRPSDFQVLRQRWPMAL